MLLNKTNPFTHKKPIATQKATLDALLLIIAMKMVAMSAQDQLKMN